MVEAGWFPNRNVLSLIELPIDFDFPELVLDILAEFGNLKVGSNGKGISGGRSTIDFRPILLQGENDEAGRFIYFSRITGITFYPLGEIDGGHGFLAVDIIGRVFVLSSWITLHGETFKEGLNSLLIGIQWKNYDEKTKMWI